MKQKFYRVESNNIDLSKIYCSNDRKYGQNLNFENYIHFLNVYFSIMKTNNISVDFLVTLNNNLYLHGNEYIKIIRNAIVNEEYVDIEKITNNIKHKNQFISISSINKFIQSFDEPNNFIFFDNGSYLWEYINECIRLNFFKDKPIRLNSIFLFDNLDSCNYYISRHLNGKGKIYEIELIQIDQLFKSDMKIIDNLENQILFEDLVNEFMRYWKAEYTREPIKEIIFQGKYKYKTIL